MDLSFAPQFSNIADEILARIEENSEDEWWDGILSLSVQLEETRRRLGFPEWKFKDAEWPAFLVFKAYGTLDRYGLHGICSEFSGVAQKLFASGEFSSVCIVLLRDPLDPSFHDLAAWWIDSEHNQHRQPGARKECIKTLRRWIRAVSQLSTKDQPTPGELEVLEKSIPSLDDTSDDWISGKSAAHILGIKKTKTLTNSAAQVGHRWIRLLVHFHRKQRRQAGDVSALADAVLTSRPSPDALKWAFIVDDWVIPIPSELDITKGAEVTPQLVYAQFLSRQGKYEEALTRLDKVLAIEPNYLDAVLFKGALLSDHLNREQEAIQCFNAVLEKMPESADALVGRGLARAKKNNLFQAIKDFDKALQINPKLANALAFRGVCHGNSGQLDKGIADLNEAIALSPTSAIIYAWRGNIHRGRNEQDKALSDFNEAIRRDSKLAFAYASRARLYQERRELEKALDDLNEAIRLDSTDISYHATRAAICTELGKHAEAAADYSAMLDRDPNQTEARWQRSEQYRKLRQYDKALADCQKLNLLLMVEVVSESAPLQAGDKTMGTVSKGDELQVTRVNADWLWVEAVLASGDTVEGWIDQKHVR